MHNRGVHVVQKGTLPTCAIMVELLGQLHRQNDAGLLFIHVLKMLYFTCMCRVPYFKLYTTLNYYSLNASLPLGTSNSFQTTYITAKTGGLI